jgi:hypothetical protein
MRAGLWDGRAGDHHGWLLGAGVAAVLCGAASIAFDLANPFLDLLLHFGPTVVGLGVLVALIGWHPRGPAAFELAARRMAFVAPANRRRSLEVAALTLILGSQAALFVERTADSGSAALDIGLSALFVAAVAALLVHAWLVPPELELSPEGVRVASRLRPVTVPWEALHHGTPWAPRLRTQRLELVTRTGFHRVPVDVLDIHPWFLADAIRYYVAHPEHRAAIGRGAEHERLCRRLRDGGAPPALPAPPTRPALPGPRRPQESYSRTRA